MTLEDQLYEIEKKFWTEGAAFYRAHTGDKCLTMFLEMAGLIDREKIAVAAGEGGRWKSIGIVRKGFVQPSDTVAIISYEAGAGRSDGKSYQALVSTAYARNGTDWKMIFHQQTPLESKPPVIG